MLHVMHHCDAFKVSPASIGDTGHLQQMYLLTTIDSVQFFMTGTLHNFYLLPN